MLTTKARDDGSESRQAALKAYVKGLSDLPADLALAAVTNYRDKFFPALAELRDPVLSSREYRRRVQIRGALRAALQDGAKAPKKRVKYEDVKDKIEKLRGKNDAAR